MKTMATLNSFILAMVRFPDVQRKAKEELYGILSGDRLPSLDDRPRLPYMEAFLKELYRQVSKIDR